MAHLKNLRSARNIADLRVIARRRVPGFSFDYVDGGAEDEVAMNANRAAFAALRIVPAQLAGLGALDTSVEIFGRRSSLPLTIAPTGYNGLLAGAGDLVLAKLARDEDIPFTQSTMSSSSIEEVSAAIQGGRHWFQLYMLRDRGITERLVQRALDSGCEALVLTTDSVVVGNREGDKRWYSAPGKLTFRAKLDILSRPAWIKDVLLPNGPPGFGNLVEFLPRNQASAIDGARFISSQMDTTISWQSVEWLRSIWPRKLIVKGLLCPQDAAMAEKHGADGIVVSNHGGRQLDSAPASIEMLRRIAAALDGRCDVFLDSGIRRGSDVLKSVLLGARTVLSGRAILYGLAAGGAPGAARSVAILRDELRHAMLLAGVDSLSRKAEQPIGRCG